MIKRRIKIINELGLHARAASLFVKTSQRFASNVQVSRRGVVANGKNIMSVMLLAASRNTMINLEIDGADEEEATKAIVALIRNRFGEER